MSIFLEVLKCLLCCEDEHENYHGSYNQIPRQTSFHHNDYEYRTPRRNYSPPLTSTNQSPALYNYKPPSPPPQAPKSPFSSSSSSPKPPTSSSKPQQSSSPSPNFPTSLSKTQPSSSFYPYSTFPEPPSSSSKPPQSTFVNPSSYKPLQSSVNASSFTREFLTIVFKSQESSSVDQPSALPKPPTSSSKLPQSTLISPSSPSLQFQTPSSRPSPPKLSTASSKPPQASSKSHSSSPNPPTSSKPSPSSGSLVSSTKLPPIFKQVLSPACPSVINQKVKKNYVWVEKDPLPIFLIPEDIKDLIKNDIGVPNVLNQPLSPATYKDYFAALLYAEEFYHEKWADFNMKNVTLKLHEAAVYKYLEKEEKTFIEFEIDSVPEKRPFLLSRDIVYVRPSGTNVDQFQGIIYRIIRSSLVLVEFEDEFYAHHDSTQKYDVSFSFNRVCLKRAHKAVQTASDALFKNFLFPDCVSRTSIPTAPALLSTHPDKLSAVRRILSIRGSPPYLVAGSTTRGVVTEAVRQLCQTSPENKFLICAPSNRCCDEIMRSLLKVIPETDMFRANAAFREKHEVPDDILPSCRYKETYFSCPPTEELRETYFSCPPTEELREFRVIFSTYISSFRLHDKGLTAGHFSHIFLVDASSAIEPETAVALTNFAEKSTTVIVTGQPGDRSRWVRADMARERGLKISYFERLFKSRPYRSLNPMLITHLDQ
ncbi:hypothetical protein L3X38_001348 [Prunus dulcis]|uniref:Helicase MOV-10-like beta-barrel domain-containing protein n=1 Tax=Prunus dulcis TaxID=3755 RepID=A0AAD4WSI1_PRUDU|nr:hypothetical protein L3X38_001348 [Prunus dulcis]